MEDSNGNHAPFGIDASSFDAECIPINEIASECGLKIPARLVPASYTPKAISFKGCHWIIAKNTEKYGVDVDMAPWELSTKEALDEIKWSLTTAVSTSLFVVSADGISCNRNCRIKGLSQGCVISLLSEISGPVLARECLERYVISHSAVPTLQSLIAWVSSYLTKWKQRAWNLPIENFLQCFCDFRPLLKELLFVYQMVEPFLTSVHRPKSDLASTISTNCFYVAQAASIAFEEQFPARRLALELLSVAISATLADISRWIGGKESWRGPCNKLDGSLEGDIRSSDIFLMDDDNGTLECSVAGTRSIIIAPIVKELLSARKSAIIMQRLANYERDLYIAILGNTPALSDILEHCNLSAVGRTVLSSAQSSMISAVIIFRHRLQQEITQSCLAVSRALISVLLDQFHLGAFFKELRDIITLATVATNNISYELALEELASAASLQRYCEMTTERFLNNFYVGSFRFQWQFYINDVSTPDSEPIAELRLSCEVPWPLNLVITEKHMIAYSKMLRLFFELECARTRVARLRFSDLASSGAAATKLSIQRFELFEFLTRILAAVCNEFVGRFDIENILAASSINELCQRHDRMLKTLLNVTLSDDRTVAWTKLMSKVTLLSSQLKSHWDDAVIATADLNDFRLTFDSCQRLFNTILSKRYAKFAH